MDWDVFISHASEDKESFARPLAKALENKGLRVWFDEFTLTVGDSLRRSIDRGLANSRYGIVILSPNFFAKEWPQKELDALVTRETLDTKVILPIWHNIMVEQVGRYSPLLAGRLAVSSSRGLDYVVAELFRAMSASSIREPSTRRQENRGTPEKVSGTDLFNPQITIQRPTTEQLLKLSVITPARADRVRELVRLGKGTLNGAALCEGRLFIASSHGIQVYRSPSLEPWYAINTGAWMTAVAASQRGHLVAAGSSDGRVWVWFLSGPTEKMRFEIGSSGVLSIAFNRDGTLFACGTGDGKIYIWDTNSKKEIMHLETFKPGRGGASSIVFTPDNKLLISNSGWEWMHTYDLTTGKLSRENHGNLGYRSITANSTGTMLAVASRAVYLWSKKDWGFDYSRPLGDRSDDITDYDSVAFSEDDKYIAAGSSKGCLALWRLSDGKLVQSVEQHRLSVNGVMLGYEKNWAISTSVDGTICLWENSFRGLQVKKTVADQHFASVGTVAFSPDGESLISGSEDGSVQLWNAQSGTLVRRFIGNVQKWLFASHYRYVGALLFSSNRNILSWAYDNEGTLRYWEVDSCHVQRHRRHYFDFVNLA